MKPWMKETYYVIVNKMSRQPFCEHRTIYAYTQKDLANQSLTADSMMIQVFESDSFHQALIHWYVMGFETLQLDHEHTIPLSQCEGMEKRSNFGYHNPQLCMKLLEYKDYHASKIAELHELGGKDFTEETKKDLANRLEYTMLYLLQSDLLLPINEAEGKPIIPKIQFSTGEQMVGLFTDHQAVLHYEKYKGSVNKKHLLIEQYRTIVKQHPDCAGIVINPKREEIIIRRNQLEHLEQYATRYEMFDFAKMELHKYQQQNRQQANSVKEEVVLAARHNVGKRLLDLPAWFVAFHPSMEGVYPLYAADGAIQVFTSEQQANEARQHFMQSECVDFQIKRIGLQNQKLFLANMIHIGVTLLRVDNGDYVVDIEMGDMVLMCEKELVSQMTQGLRHQILRTKQYAMRIGALDYDQHKDTVECMNRWMLTARMNSYRELYRHPIYVLGVKGTPNQTRYTPQAWKMTQEYRKRHQLDDEQMMCCYQDTSITLYEGVLSFAFVNRQQDGKNHGYICVFSEGRQAKQMCEIFRQQNVEVDVLVVTFAQLMSQAQQCDGIVLDSFTLDFAYEKEEYENMEKWGKLEQPLVAKVNKKVS